MKSAELARLAAMVDSPYGNPEDKIAISTALQFIHDLECRVEILKDQAGSKNDLRAELAKSDLQVGELQKKLGLEEFRVRYLREVMEKILSFSASGCSSGEAISKTEFRAKEALEVTKDDCIEKPKEECSCKDGGIVGMYDCETCPVHGAPKQKCGLNKPMGIGETCTLEVGHREACDYTKKRKGSP